MPNPSSKASLAEAILVFAFVMAYIWKLRYDYPALIVPVLGLIFLSHILHRESASKLGFRKAGFAACARKFGPVTIGFVLLLFGLGMLFGTIRPLSFVQAAAALGIYLPWGLFQQYLLNGYFLRRFETLMPATMAGSLTAALFCAAHAPNWFLMGVTLVGGYCSVWVYRRHGNLYVIGLAHAILGFTLSTVVPDSITHHLRVGPGWYVHR